MAGYAKTLAPSVTLRRKGSRQASLMEVAGMRWVFRGHAQFLSSIAFRQNITIQFCSNLLPVEREEAAIRIRVYPCPSVAKSLVFFGVRSALEVWFLGHGWTRIHTDRMFRFY